nr:MAG TPA: hypothetical protein [Caudoviricetes sp.]
MGEIKTLNDLIEQLEWCRALAGNDGNIPVAIYALGVMRPVTLNPIMKGDGTYGLVIS